MATTLRFEALSGPETTPSLWAERELLCKSSSELGAPDPAWHKPIVQCAISLVLASHVHLKTRLQPHTTQISLPLLFHEAEPQIFQDRALVDLASWEWVSITKITPRLLLPLCEARVW